MAQGQIGVANNLEKLKLMKQMHMMPPMAPLADPAAVKPPESLGKRAGNMVVDTALTKGIDKMFTTGAESGMGAAMGAAGPYALAAMAAGKLFGLFSSGGHVGPLYAAEGKMAYPSYSGLYNTMSDKDYRKYLDSLTPEEREAEIKTIGIEEAMDAMYNSSGTKAPVGQRMMQGGSPENSFAGPISKLKLQDAEGNVKETTYGR